MTLDTFIPNCKYAFTIALIFPECCGTIIVGKYCYICKRYISTLLWKEILILPQLSASQS